jgi:hypothetical protein
MNAEEQLVLMYLVEAITLQVKIDHNTHRNRISISKHITHPTAFITILRLNRINIHHNTQRHR